MNHKSTRTALRQIRGAEQICYTANRRGDDGSSIRHRFDQRQRRSFVYRGERHDVERRVKVFRIVAQAGEENFITNTKRIGLCLKRPSQVSVTDNNKTYPAILCLVRTKQVIVARHDSDKHFVILNLSQPANYADCEIVLLDSQFFSRGFSSLFAIRKSRYV